jgi:DNA polymerase-3 subunit gamma/tau
MSTLYRKYRPQKFGEIHDQEHIVQTITNEISTGKIAHAYLFTGPRGVGKTTIARLLAKALNCQNRQTDNFEPCNQCSSCQEIAAGRNIDVIEIDAASNTGVDNVRENIIDNAQFRPTKSKYKIFIIDEVHMLSGSAFNALLKTIEEPPEHVLFILATTELNKLPATIVSRCQRFGFKKITREEMLKKLEKICQQEKVKVSKEVLQKIITKSEGGMRDAESLLGQILALNLKSVDIADVEVILPTSDWSAVLNFIKNIHLKNTALALEQINQLVENGINLEQFCLDTIELLRGTLIAQSGYEISELLDIQTEIIKEIKKLSKEINSAQLIAMIDGLLSRKREIKQSPIAQLPLELFAVQFSTKDNAISKDTPPASKSEDSTKKTPKTEKKLPAEETKTLSQTIKTAISELTHKAPQSTLSDIQSQWTTLVNTISTTAPSLTFILKMCTLSTIDDSGLHLTFNFAIHKEKIEEIKNKKMIEDELEKIFKERIKIVCELNEEAVKNYSDREIGDLAASFGGEIM